MRQLLTSKIFWGIALLVVVIVLYVLLRPEPQPEYTTAAVASQTLVQTVSVTGAVRGSSEIELNFETTGELAELLVTKGQAVTAGQVLGRLSSDKITSQINEANAAVSAAQAELNKLLTGASSAEITVSQQKIASANTTLALRKQDLVDLEAELAADEVIKQAAVTSAQRDLVTTRDNLIRSMENELFDASTALNRIFDILDDADKTSTLGALDTATKNATVLSYDTAVMLKNSAENMIDIAGSTKTDSAIEAALTATYDALIEVSRTLSFMHTTIVNTPPGNPYPESDINTDKANIVSDQATLSAGISSVQTAEAAWESDQTALTVAQNNITAFNASKITRTNTAKGAVQSAQSALDLANAELALLLAPARQEDIDLQRSRVAQVLAQLSRAQDDLNNITLYAPIDGVITMIDNEVGETTSLTKPVMTMLGSSDLEIEIDIPESDISKVQVGQVASITLDAFGDDVLFPGHIVFVDPAETVIQDVVYYQVTATFDNEAIGAKPGMTANIDIVTNEKENALVIPARAVKQNGTKYVEVLEGGSVVTKEITTGLRGDDGLIEITSGLAVGEQVITFVREE